MGNSEGFLMRTAEVGIHALHQFGRRQQAGGFDHGSFAMDPMRLQGVEPRAFDGQGTIDNSDALAFPFGALIVVSELLSHGLAAVPRCIIPHQQQRRFARGGQLDTDPGQKLDRSPHSRVGRPRSAATRAPGSRPRGSALASAGHNKPKLWGQDRQRGRFAR